MEAGLRAQIAFPGRGSYPGAMREAKSYSIVDHQLLHGGYLGRLTHPALALYLFLIVVGDREGRSFYSDASIGGILRLSGTALADARQELIASGLIRYRRPHWWVESLTRATLPAAPPRPSAAMPIRQQETRMSCPASIRGAVPEALRELIRTLEERS